MSYFKHYKRLKHRTIGYRLLKGEGLEISAFHHPARLSRKCKVNYCDALSKEETIKLFPELKRPKFVKPDYICDLDKRGLYIFDDNTFDFTILNHTGSNITEAKVPAMLHRAITMIILRCRGSPSRKLSPTPNSRILRTILFTFIVFGLMSILPMEWCVNPATRPVISSERSTAGTICSGSNPMSSKTGVSVVP